ncbi:hypothetical protein VKT23_014512 [Stygiomarasmius scandens]|uniref:Heterokaryon incompatibility domain-containing protein n=1 Tax=Marasmiellus scandens TaxID=2682957 RepID=A0ABR1J040_9AGAR
MPDVSPTRLFKIDKDAVKKGYDKDTVYGTLIEGEELTKGKKYCAVSHVWGPGASIINIDFQPIPWPVPIESSAEKLLFILDTCAKQGYEYVWLDILCIKQGRGDAKPAADEDQKKEMPRMYSYYRGDAMVFGRQYKDFATRWDVVGNVLKIWDKDREGKESNTRKVVWEGLGAIQDFISDEWFSRVWTLQEAVLPSRLLTSNGATIDFKFCDLIEWTYIALGTQVLNSRSGDAHYPWIHPGAGVVNDKGWWMVSQGFLLTTKDGRARDRKLHPLEALIITRNRNTGHEIDKLRGTYGIIDEQWHVLEENDFKKAWETTVDKYIEREEPDVAPLVTMAVTASTPRTWGAGDSKYMGSVVPRLGNVNRTATLSQGVLSLTVSGVSKIKGAPTRATAYGDGSGELALMISDLRTLKDQHHIDISSALLLLNRAVNHATQKIHNTLEELEEAISPNYNAVSSGLREVFSGWDRWIVVTGQGSSQAAFLAWFPRTDESEKAESVKKRLDGCSLLWSYSGSNEWAVIVEGDPKAFKKVGIAFVNSKHQGPEAKVVVI